MPDNTEFLDACSAWIESRAKGPAALPHPVLLYSETVNGDSATVTDCGYFILFLHAEDAKDGKPSVLLYSESTVYARSQTGEPEQQISTVRRPLGIL